MHLTLQNKNLVKNVIYQGPSRLKARAAEAATGRVGRGEQSEERPGNRAPRGGPQLDRVIFEDGSKSGLQQTLRLLSCNLRTTLHDYILILRVFWRFAFPTTVGTILFSL